MKLKRNVRWVIALLAASGLAACEPRPPKPKTEVAAGFQQADKDRNGRLSLAGFESIALK